MKTTMMSAVRILRNAFAQRGITIRSVRGRDFGRAGVECLWNDVDAGHERVTISDVSFGEARFKMLVRNPDDWIQSHHFRGIAFAEDELRQIGRIYRGKTFVDVGANVGNHSIVAARALGAARVVAFEPNPVASRILLTNIALNDLTDTIVHHAIGLSDTDGSATAFEPTTGLNLGGTKLIRGLGDLVLKRGDDVLGGEEIGFIKIDVEGAELQALAGLEKTIAAQRPPMLVEVDDRNVEPFRSWLASMNYQVAARARPGEGNEDYFLVPSHG